jgi:hypothetical protein
VGSDVWAAERHRLGWWLSAVRLGLGEGVTMERLGEGGDVPTVGEQRAARHGDLDITDQGVGRGGSRRGGDGKRWRSLLLKRMDWRKKRYVSRTPSRASGRVARCSCFPDTLLCGLFFFIRPCRPCPLDGNRRLPPRRP